MYHEKTNHYPRNKVVVLILYYQFSEGELWFSKVERRRMAAPRGIEPLLQE